MVKINTNHLLFFAFIFFIALRVITISIIQHDRELPIEVDDSYIYISKSSNLIVPIEENIFITSSKKIIDETYRSDPKNQTLVRYKHFANVDYSPYFLHSKIMKFLKNNFLDYESILWFSYYLNQLITVLSVYFFALIFFNKDNVLVPVAIFFSSFIFIEFIHQITATPFSIGNALLLISISFLIRFKSYLFLIPLLVSLLFHPGIFIVLLAIMASFILNSFLYENKKDLKIFLFTTFFVLLILLFDFINTYFFDGKTFTYFFSALSDDFDKLNLFEILKFNFFELIKRLNDLTGLYFIKYISLIIYPICLYTLFNLNKKLFIFNIVFILLSIFSLFHYLPQHPAELIEYFGQTFIILIIFTYIICLKKIFLYIRNSSFKKGNIFLLFFIFVLLTTYIWKTINIIDSRSNRHNIPSYNEQLINLNNTYSGEQILITDSFTYLMGQTYLTNLEVKLDDNILNQIKWKQNKCNTNMLYFGLNINSFEVCGKNYLIDKIIFCNNDSYCISLFKEIN